MFNNKKNTTKQSNLYFFSPVQKQAFHGSKINQMLKLLISAHEKKKIFTYVSHKHILI